MMYDFLRDSRFEGIKPLDDRAHRLILNLSGICEEKIEYCNNLY